MQKTELHRIMKTTKNRYHYQIRRCRRVEEYIRNNKMVTNCIDTDLDLFAEIKKQRMDKNQDEVTIDGVAGKRISEKFAEIYKKLYNTVEDVDQVKKVDRKVQSSITNADSFELDRITAFSIQEAVKKIKPNKSDPIFKFSSDFLKNAQQFL